MPIPKYTTGSTSKSGKTIGHIYGWSPIAIVFTENDSDDSVSWETDEIKVDGALLTARFDTIRSSIPLEIPSDVRKVVLRSLRIALFNALCAEDDNQALNYFSPVEQSVKRLLTPHQAKANLVFQSILLAITFASLMFILYRNSDASYRFVFACAAGGIFGSLFSLLQRNSKYDIDLRSGGIYIFLQALFVTILGAMSGTAVYTAVMSDLAFGFASKNAHALLLISMASGFSERLVPDLFGKLDRQNP